MLWRYIGLCLGRLVLQPGLSDIQRSDADQVVDRDIKLEPGTVAVLADVTELAATTDGLDPPEWFLHPLTYPLTDLMACVSGSATIDP